MSEPQLNSTTHGCCAVELMVLAHESKEEFKHCYDSWMETYHPRTPTEENLVEQLIAADWLNQRSVKTYARVEAELYAIQPNPLHWTDEQHKALARFARYRTANQNAFKKAQKTIEDYHLTRKNMSLKIERLNIAKTRLKIYEQKNAPEPTWDQLIEMQTKIGQANMKKLQQEVDALKK